MLPWDVFKSSKGFILTFLVRHVEGLPFVGCAPCGVPEWARACLPAKVDGLFFCCFFPPVFFVYRVHSLLFICPFVVYMPFL